MSKKNVPDAREEEGESGVQSGEAAPAGGQSSPTVHANGRSGNTGDEIDSASPNDAVARIILQAQQLAHGVKEVAAKEAKLQAAEILSEAEAKAREQILEPAATRAAARSQEIMAEAEQEADAILAGIRRLFSSASSDESAGDDSAGDEIADDDSADDGSADDESADDGSADDESADDDSAGDDSAGDDSAGDDSAVAPTESASASDSVNVEGSYNLPPPMSPMQRDQLKEVIARRMGAP